MTDALVAETLREAKRQQPADIDIDDNDLTDETSDA